MMFMKTSVLPLFDFNEVLHTLTYAKFFLDTLYYYSYYLFQKTAHDEWSFWQHLFIWRKISILLRYTYLKLV